MSIKRQTLWSMLPLIVVSVLNIASVPLFYRFLGPILYALWFYVLTFTGAFGFVDLGLGVAVGRYVGVALGKNDLEAVREYWGTGNAIAIPLLAMMGIVFAAIGVFLGPTWFNVDPTLVRLLRWSFVAGGAALFLSYYGQFWLILSQAHLDFKFLSLLRTTVSVAQIIPSIALAWATRSPLVLILWSVAVGLAQLSIFIWHARNAYSLRFDFRHARIGRAREMAAYTAKTFATLLANSFFGSVDRLVLGKLAPPVQFASYTICANAGGRILGLSAAMMGPVFSNTNRAVGRGTHESVSAVYNEVFNFIFPWCALISIWAFLWHPVLLRVWLGEQLGERVAPLFSPIVIGCCLTAISNISTAQLGSLNRVGTGLFFNTAAGIALIIGVFVGWRWNGVAGVAWAFLASRAVLVAQDLFVIRLTNAGGWLASRTWKILAIQVVTGLGFSSAWLLRPITSRWQIVPASLHALVVTGWLLRGSARRLLLFKSNVAKEAV
jgi:O-antigen/teichoic acid export membrane protein